MLVCSVRATRKENYDPTYVAYSWIFNTAAILQTTGVINLLRVHDVKPGSARRLIL
jgi:hypothetical protein